MFRNSDMAMAFHLESQTLVPSKHSLLLNPIDFTSHLSYFTSKFPNFHSSHSLSHQTQTVCRRKKRRSSGSQKIMKFLPKLMSNLKMFPEPLDLIIAEIGGGAGAGAGAGGNSGFWNGFVGGNSDGWRRKGHKNLLLLRVLAIWGLGLILFGRDLKNETLCGVLVLGFLVPILFDRLKKGRIQDWILDVCLVGALMGWWLRREDVLQWVQKIRVSSPLMELVKGKQTSRRRRRIL